MRLRNPYYLLLRPKTLPASIGPVLVGLSFAGIDTLKNNLFLSCTILACALLLQISANIVNDYYDNKNGVDGHDRLGPKRLTSSKEINEKNVRTSFILTLLLSCVLGFFLFIQSGWPTLYIGIFAIAAAFLYTGGPKPLSHYAMGELLALVFFGPLAVWGTHYIVTTQQRIDVLYAGLGPGFISLSIMAINNMRDRVTDSKNSKVTVAVILGERRSRYVPIFGILAASSVAFSFFIYQGNPYYLAPAFCFLLFSNNWHRILKGPIDRSQNTSLALTGTYLLLYCVLFSLVVL